MFPNLVLGPITRLLGDGTCSTKVKAGRGKNAYHLPVLSSSGYRYDGRRKVSQTVAEECDKGTSVAKCEPKLVIPLVEAGSESTAQLQQQLDMEGRGMAVDVEKGLWLV